MSVFFVIMGFFACLQKTDTAILNDTRKSRIATQRQTSNFDKTLVQKWLHFEEADQFTGLTLSEFKTEWETPSTDKVSVKATVENQSHFYSWLGLIRKEAHVKEIVFTSFQKTTSGKAEEADLKPSYEIGLSAKIKVSASTKADRVDIKTEEKEHKQAKDNIPRTPLQLADIESYALKATYIGEGKRYAVLKKRDDNAHVVEIDSYVGTQWGKVTKIENGSISITEEYLNINGERLEKKHTKRIDTKEALKTGAANRKGYRLITDKMALPDLLRVLSHAHSFAYIATDDMDLKLSLNRQHSDYNTVIKSLIDQGQIYKSHHHSFEIYSKHPINIDKDPHPIDGMKVSFNFTRVSCSTLLRFICQMMDCQTLYVGERYNPQLSIRFENRSIDAVFFAIKAALQYQLDIQKHDKFIVLRRVEEGKNNR